MLLDERSQEQFSLRGKGSRGDISLQDHDVLDLIEPEKINENFV